MPMGRPKKAEGALVPITVKITSEMKEQLESLALEDARTLAQITRFAIEEGVVQIKATGLKNLKTKGRRRRTVGGADKVVRSVSSRRAKVQGIRERGSLAGRNSGERGILNQGGTSASAPPEKRTKHLPPAA